MASAGVLGAGVPESAATISNDPFFIARGQKTHFWLPVHASTPLLNVHASSSEVYTLMGETFGDRHASQWFKEYELKVNEASMVRILVGAHVGASLKTMQLWVNGTELLDSFVEDTKLVAGHGITVHVRRLPRRMIVDLAAEQVTIISQALNVTIWTSPARKSGFSEKQQLQYAHLNMDVNWRQGVATGLVAEMAGEQAVSPSTRLLLKPPLGFVPSRPARQHERKWREAQQLRHQMAAAGRKNTREVRGRQGQLQTVDEASRRASQTDAH